MDDTRIIVSDIPSEFTAENVEDLIVILENRRKGGGTVKDFEFDESSRTVLVNFEESRGLRIVFILTLLFNVMWTGIVSTRRCS